MIYGVLVHAELAIAFAGALAFTVLYGWKANWYASEVGRCIMLLWSVASVVLLCAATRALRYPFIAIPAFAAIDYVILRWFFFFFSLRRKGQLLPDVPATSPERR